MPAAKEKEYDKKFRFTITTNGLLLNDDMIDFINKEMYNVVCSTDGRKEINDRVRARVDGSGCYDAIIPHFQELVRKRENSEYPRTGSTMSAAPLPSTIWTSAKMSCT